MKNLFILSVKAIFFSVATVAVMISSCKVNQNPNEELVTIDAGKAYNKPARDIMLSELVEDIEYVKLETSPDCLISRPQGIVTSENYIVVLDRNTKKVHLFTKEGKYLNDIGNIGKGPGEYIQVYGAMTISPDEKFILLKHSWIWGWFNMYNIDGSFIKKLTIPPARPGTFGYFGTDNFVTITCNFASRQGFPDLFETDNQLFIYDKEINLTDSLRLSYGDANMVTGKGFRRNAMYIYKGNIYLQQQSNDTIFRIDQTYSITPHLVIDLGGLKIPSPIVPGSEGGGSTYYGLSEFTTINNYDFIRLSGGNLHKFLVYYRISAETFFLYKGPDPYYKDLEPRLRIPRWSIINDMDGIKNPPILFSICPLNDKMIDYLDIIDAKPYLESGAVNPKKLVTDKYYNELSKLLAESDIEDNPIFRIFHFK